MTYWLLPFTFQLVLQSIVVAIFGLIFGKPIGIREGVLMVRWHRWFDHRWPFATTIAYVMGGSKVDFADARLWFHEVGVHVKQYEDLAVLSDIIAAVVLLWGYLAGVSSWPLALGIWASGGPLWMLPWFLTALRHRAAGKSLKMRLWEIMYRFSWHEKDAYAETRVWQMNGGR